MDFSSMGAVPGGYMQGRQQLNNIDQQDMQLVDQRAKQVGMAAYFRALQGMMGGAQGGGMMQSPGQGPQPPMPGQSSMPQPPPMAMNPQGAPMRGSDGGMMPPDMGMQTQPASGMGQPTPAGPPGASVSPPTAPGGQPQMTWQGIAQALKQQNPGASDLELAHALDKFMPMMTLQAQADWRNIRSEVLERIAGIKADAQIGAAGTRADASRDVATTTAGSRVEAAGRRADATVTAAEKRVEEQRANREQRENQFQQKEKRLVEGLQLRSDTTWARIDQQRAALEQRIAQGERGAALKEWRAALDAQHRLAIQKIQATSINNAMKPKDREQMLKDANEWHREQIGKLNEITSSAAKPRGNLTDGGSTVTGMSVEDKPVVPSPPTAPAAPAVSAPEAPGAQPIPQAFAADPDGSKYQKDGKTWVKQGNQLVLENGG